MGFVAKTRLFVAKAGWYEQDWLQMPWGPSVPQSTVSPWGSGCNRKRAPVVLGRAAPSSGDRAGAVVVAASPGKPSSCWECGLTSPLAVSQQRQLSAPVLLLQTLMPSPKPAHAAVIPVARGERGTGSASQRQWMCTAHRMPWWKGAFDLSAASHSPRQRCFQRGVFWLPPPGSTLRSLPKVRALTRALPTAFCQPAPSSPLHTHSHTRISALSAKQFENRYCNCVVSELVIDQLGVGLAYSSAGWQAAGRACRRLVPGFCSAWSSRARLQE